MKTINTGEQLVREVWDMFAQPREEAVGEIDVLRNHLQNVLHELERLGESEATLLFVVGTDDDNGEPTYRIHYPGSQRQVGRVLGQGHFTPRCYQALFGPPQTICATITKAEVRDVLRLAQEVNLD